MSNDKLHYHIANLGLIIIGILSIYKIVALALVSMLLLPGVIFGFLFSWQFKEKRLQNIDLFIGMLSLASVVISLSRLYELEINFINLLTIFSTALVWLGLFQSFGIRPNEGGYALIQFISALLLVSSIALALEQESLYLIYLAIYLFLLIFSLRINLVIEKKRKKGCVIVGEEEDALGLWPQLRLSVIIFSALVLITSLLFPFMPRFENVSLQWIPSDLLGLPERMPLLKLISDASRKIKEDKTLQLEQLADDRIKKRETGNEMPLLELEEEKKQIPYDMDEIPQQIEALNIAPSSVEVPLNKTAQLRVEVKLKDGTILDVTNLVEWENQNSEVLEVEQDGDIRPISEGSSIVSARFKEVFSNTAFIIIAPPQLPPKKFNFICYILLFFWWILLGTLAYLYIKIMMHRARLRRFASESPRVFIRQLYIYICKILKIIGHPRSSHIAQREFVEILKQVQKERIVHLQQMTEKFLEAEFSTHKITKEDSFKVLKIFHATCEGFFEQAKFLQKIAGRILMLGVPTPETT